MPPTKEQAIKFENAFHYVILILSCSLIILGIAIKDHIILMGIGIGLIGPVLIYIIQRELKITPILNHIELKDELNTNIIGIKSTLEKFFFGSVITSLKQIYEDSLQQIEFAIKNGYNIYELSTSHNSEYAAMKVIELLEETKTKDPEQIHFFYTMFFDKDIDQKKIITKQYSNIQEKWTKEINAKTFIKKVEDIELTNIKIYNDVDVPIDCLLIMNGEDPIYGLVELYDYKLNQETREVLSFSTKDYDFLIKLYAQIKGLQSQDAA